MCVHVYVYVCIMCLENWMGALAELNGLMLVLCFIFKDHLQCM